jgi:hypothetical protein
MMMEQQRGKPVDPEIESLNATLRVQKRVLDKLLRTKIQEVKS